MSETIRGLDVAVAARRVSGAEAGLAALALVSFALVFLRLFERWRVGAGTVSHRVAILGQQLSYPAANLAAIVVIALALLGATVVSIVLATSVRELKATRRVARHLAAGRQAVLKEALVIESARPQAFAFGLFKPRVYVSTGALAFLDAEALDAVLMHERHHARRRDPLRLAASRLLGKALFFVPGFAELGRRRETLGEISADLAAINQGPASRSALARAMLSFNDFPGADGSGGIDPARVDHLVGEPPSWRFPTLMVLLAAFVLALLGGVAVLAGQEAAGSASLAPPFLSAQPCVVVLALVPAALGLAAIAVVRYRRGTLPMLTSGH